MSLPMTLTKYDAVPMTPSRRYELLEELASTVADRKRLKMHNDDLAEKARDLLKSRDTRITELTDQLTLGTEAIGRDCELEYILLTNTTIVKDAKTKEILETRAMTSQERASLIDENDSQPDYSGHGKRGKRR